MTQSLTTAHAVVRYLRRIDGVDIRAVRGAMKRMGIQDLSDKSVLGFIETHTAIDVSRAKRAINRREVIMAARAGASAIIIGGIRFVIDGGCVSTVLAHRATTRGRLFRDVRRIRSWRHRHWSEVAEEMT